ncbi:MAG: multidrug efflux RND transporter permease subunit [Muribaculaceae bacterium]|nr:multidrug efflux RND transporter permease subunit [Muribaculaceae bacterium]
MFSKFFIDRPIFATVLAILMIIVGVITVKTLPLAQYPDITPPTVMVTASYPGADAQTVAETVGVPIEEQVNGVEGMMYMSSDSNSDGSYNLTITFEVGTDLDMATVKVQNRVALAEAQLPTAVKEQGVSVTSQASNMLMFVALQTDDRERYDALYLTNYAKLNVVDELSRIDGVGGVQAFGAGEYSMRIWLKPDEMRVRGLTPADVMSMIQSQNMEVSAGSTGESPVPADQQFQYTLTARGRLITPEEFGNIILRTEPSGAMLRLQDVADVELGSQTYSMQSSVSGVPAGLIGISQLPGANALDVAKACEARLEQLQQYFPKGIHYNVILNTTDVVNASIDEVLMTFAETTLIVMLVILLFLQNWRAVVIPMLTIPVSLIATFAVMKLLGFTINTLTLFGLVLAIAIVVDDAIVVVEDCARLLDQGKLTPRQAAEKAMNELQGPVVGEVLVLLSVFIPTAFISGITGQLYKQFALTIAVSTAFSGFNALTFTPAMCALFLRPRKPAKFFVYRWFNKAFNGTLNAYSGVVGRMLKHPMLAFTIFGAIIAVAIWGFVKLPTSYIPEEDNGYFMTSVQLPTGASLERTDSVMSRITKDILTIPEVKDVISVAGNSFIGGGNTSNVGSFFVVLKPWSERKGKGQDATAIMDKVNELTADIQEAIVFSVNPPAIPGLGSSSGLEMQLLDINNLGAAQMKEALAKVQETALKNPKIKSVTSMYEGEVPQYTVKINRDRVKLYNLTLESVYSTLSAYMGGAYVNDFVEFGRVYQVNVKAKGSARRNPQDVLNLTVRNNEDKMVPFAAFATVEPVMGQATVARYNMYNTASLTATTAKNVSSSEGIAIMEDVVKEALGNQYSYAWTGESYQETSATTTITSVLLFAIIITILVLAAQYESWTDPIAVIITTPTAILGTVIGCLFMSQNVNIYTQIGIILLLGMAAKNAILIVEYAMDYRKAGLPIRQAAMDAGKVRLRPILMTALAFVFGVMPMLFATGAGANSRIALGTAVVFGMAVNAVLGTLFVPNFWELLQHFQEKYLSKIFAGATKPSGQDTNTTSPDDGI